MQHLTKITLSILILMMLFAVDLNALQETYCLLDDCFAENVDCIDIEWVAPGTIWGLSKNNDGFGDCYGKLISYDKVGVKSKVIYLNKSDVKQKFELYNDIQTIEVAGLCWQEKLRLLSVVGSIWARKDHAPYYNYYGFLTRYNPVYLGLGIYPFYDTAVDESWDRPSDCATNSSGIIYIADTDDNLIYSAKTGNSLK